MFSLLVAPIPPFNQHNALFPLADIQREQRVGGRRCLIIYCLAAEFSLRPGADIISKQQTEEQHAGLVIATLGQVRRRRETSPRGDCICFICKRSLA